MGLQCKLQKSFQPALAEKSEKFLLGFFQGFSILNSSQFFFLISFLGFIGALIWFSQSNTTDDEKSESSSSKTKSSSSSNDDNEDEKLVAEDYETRIFENEKTVTSTSNILKRDSQVLRQHQQQNTNEPNKRFITRKIETIYESQLESSVLEDKITSKLVYTENTEEKIFKPNAEVIDIIDNRHETTNSEQEENLSQNDNVEKAIDIISNLKIQQSSENKITQINLPINIINKRSIEETSENKSFENVSNEQSIEEFSNKKSVQTISSKKKIDDISDKQSSIKEVSSNKSFENISNKQTIEETSIKKTVEANKTSASCSTASSYLASQNQNYDLQTAQLVDKILSDLISVDSDETIYSKTKKSQNQVSSISRDEISIESNNSVLGLYNVKHVNAIEDRFRDLDEVSDAVKKAGLEKSQLIFGIDFTISNLENGYKTFNGRSLHYCDNDIKNPYQKVIEILGKTLECFDLDGQIPAFGFGDIKTKDRKVFPFSESGYCNGFKDVLEKYNLILKDIKLSGPTNFAPLIREAIRIVKETKQYHILVIVADGQVTNERQTRDAIVEASKYPISIIMVGVGDGPWERMNEFDDSLPKRQFDNFQFVNYHEVIDGVENPDETFALHALMEIPDQFKAIRELRLLKR